MLGAWFKSSVGVFAVVVIGVLSGLYVGTGLAQYSNLDLPYQVWVPRQQAEVGLFKTFMPSLGWFAAILPAVAAIVSTGARRWAFAAGAVLILATIFSSTLGELPLNKIVGTWDPVTPVVGWEAMRASWLRFHWIKTTLSVFSFALAAVGGSRN